MTAAHTPTPILAVSHRFRQSTGAGRPQCRPRANCDGCAYLLTATYYLLAGQRGRAPTVSPPSVGRLLGWAGRAAGQIKTGATPTWTRAPGAEF